MEKKIQIFAGLVAIALGIYITIPLAAHSLDIVYKYWK